MTSSGFGGEGTGTDLGDGIEVGTGVDAEPKAGSRGTDGAEARPAGDNLIGGPCGFLGPKGMPKGVG